MSDRKPPSPATPPPDWASYTVEPAWKDAERDALRRRRALDELETRTPRK